MVTEQVQAKHFDPKGMRIVTTIERAPVSDLYVCESLLCLLTCDSALRRSPTIKNTLSIILVATIALRTGSGGKADTSNSTCRS